MARWTAALAVVALALGLSSSAWAGGNAYVAFDNGESNGAVAQFNIGPLGGLLPRTPLTHAAGMESTALAASPDGKSLYVADEGAGLVGQDTVSQFDIGPRGALTPKSTASVPASGGPEGIAVSPGGKHVYVATVSDVLQFDADSHGTLSSDVPAANIPTANLEGIALTPDGKSLYVTDPNGGLIYQFDVAASGALTAKSTPSVPAAGSPQEIAVNPHGKSVYAADSGGNVLQYTVGPGGKLSPKGQPSVPAGTGAEGIAMSPNGKSVYVTNPGDGTVGHYKVGPGGGLSTSSTASATGASPEGAAVNVDSKSVYVVNDDGTLARVVQFNAGPTGALTQKSPFSRTSGPFSEAVVVRPDQGPVARFTANPRVAGTKTKFNGSASSDPDGTVKRWDWSFGDGKKALNAGPKPKHKYKKAGTMHVTLTVTDNLGCSVAFVFTGQTAACPLDLAARVTRKVVIAAAKR